MTDSLLQDLQHALGTTVTLTRELGGGGMSRVFLARDLPLDRDVVVKVLPPDAAAVLSGERFRREIVLAARLQHPHIVPLLGAGQTSDGLPYYTMPFVQGETLRARLLREGELPVPEVVGIIREVARALGHAHEHGIVHRDIKPENVMLSGGAALVLDFGVAKAVTASADGDRLATLSQIGVALGTPAYMAPEQAAAEPALDHRADIYALGCVAYELLTGTTPFMARNASAMLAAQVMDIPDPVQRRRPNTPPELASLVMRCLEKRPADRPRTAGEVLQLLDVIAGTGGTSAYGLPSRGGWKSARAAALLRWAPWLVSAACLLLLAGRGRAPVTTARPVRFIVPGIVDLANNGAPAISPDGHNLVYVDRTDAAHPLFVRPMSALSGRPLPGTEGAVAPFVSPDGRWVGFFTLSNKLKKVALDGSAPPVTLAEASSLARGSWSSSDAIVFDSQEGGGLVWVPAAGGPVRKLTQVDAATREGSHVAPLALPGGRTVLFSAGSGAAREVAAVTLDPSATGAARHTRLGVQGRAVGMWKEWLLVRTEAGVLSAVHFDQRSHRVSGPVRLVVDERGGGIDPIAIADDGTLLSSRRLLTDSLVIVDERGNGRPLLGRLPEVSGWGIRGYMNPRLSPDGKRLALMASSPRGYDVWSYDLASETRTRVTDRYVYGSEWAPDGRHIVYSTNPRSVAYGPASVSDSGSGIWMQPVDGSAPARLLFRGSGSMWGNLTPDGRTLVFQRVVKGVWSIWTLDLGGDTVPTPLVQESSNAYMPRVSPDGRWMAYVSSGEQGDEVHVRPLRGSGAPIQLSERGGTEPMWAPDGRRLFYRAGSDFVAVVVRSVPSFTVLSRSVLFRGSFDGGMPHANYTVAPDGRHFVFLAASARSAPDAVVTRHWSQELRARLERPR